MGFLDFFKRLGKKSASLPMSSSQSDYSFSIGNSPKKASEYYQGWVFLCVSAIKDEIANMELILNKKDSSGQKTRLFDHAALDVLMDVNPFFTKYTLFEKLGAEMELQGNHYWLIEPDITGKPLEIYPLNPCAIRPVSDPLVYVAYYEYTIDQRKYQIPTDRIIHFKAYNPGSDILGLSTIESVKVSVQTDEAAKLYNRQFFENSATPGIVLEYPGQLNADTMARMKAQWEAEYQGFKKAYRTAIAAGGLKIHQMEYKQSDMQFMEQRKFSRDEILALFRVPPTIAGITETTVYASAKAAEYVFARRTIAPKMKRIVDTLNAFYLPLFGEEGLEFEFASPVPKDIQEQVTYYQTGIASGFLTLNEVRRMEGLPELENGDQVFLPLNLSPYTQAAAKTIVIKPEVKSLVSEAVQKMAAAFKHIEDDHDEQDERLPENELVANKWPMAEFERLGEGKAAVRNSRTRKFEKLFSKTADKLFEGQKQRAIENLQKIKGFKSTKLKASDILDKKKELKITIDLFKPLFGTVTEEEGKAALDELGLDPADFSIATPATQEFIKINTINFAGGVTDTTTEELRKLIAMGLDEGEAIDGLTARIEEYSGFGKARSELIARSEVLRNQGKAELEAWKETNIVVSKVWYTALDDRVCPECDSMQGTEVALDESFLTEEEYMQMGYDVYDGAIDSANLHPQCRCVMLPVVK